MTTHRPIRTLSPPCLALLLLLPLTGGCYARLPSNGGGDATFTPPRSVNPDDIALPAGYRIEAVAQGLTFPTGVAFDSEDRVYVVEAGYSYGEEFDTPRLMRVEPGGATTVVATGERQPWTGVTHADGAFYVAEGAHPGRILRVAMDGAITTLVDGIPSFGDHHTNGPAMGPDGWLYFGQGTATNSGVVGPDNAEFGWLQRDPSFHDIPGADIRLAGRNFTSENPLTEEPNDTATTGAYVPFGTATQANQVIPGQVPCTGAVMRVLPAGGAVELVAWGFRNPFGLAFRPDGRLFVTDNGPDRRGSRPVYGSPDFLWAVTPGSWYGWPDYVGGIPITHDRYAEDDNPRPEFVLAEHPNEPPKPVAYLDCHGSSNGIDFSRNEAFGHTGEAFIALLGDMATGVGKVMKPVGFKVVRVNTENGMIEDFAANKGHDNGPASKLGTGGLERPVAVRFNTDGSALYVVDFGVMTIMDGRPNPYKGTGVLWRITRSGER